LNHPAGAFGCAARNGFNHDDPKAERKGFSRLVAAQHCDLAAGPVVAAFGSGLVEDSAAGS
jgi:hypothetical protein